jgi:hypothetical protein
MHIATFAGLSQSHQSQRDEELQLGHSRARADQADDLETILSTAFGCHVE